MTGIAWTSPVIRSGRQGGREGGTERRNGDEPFPTLPFFSLPFLLLRATELEVGQIPKYTFHAPLKPCGFDMYLLYQ